MAEPTVVSLPWPEILKLGLGAGVTATIFGHFADWLKERWKANTAAERDATYLAARITVILEEFAIECADRISGNKVHRTSGGHAGEVCTSFPALGEYPSDAEWKALDPTLLAQALSLRNELLLADYTIEFILDVDGDPDLMPRIFDEEAGKCGYRAWQLAAKLRNRYRLSSFDSGRHSMKTLKEQHDRALKRLMD